MVLSGAVARLGIRGVGGLVRGTCSASAALTTLSAIHRDGARPTNAAHRMKLRDPNVKTFNTRAGIPPTVVTFNKLIKACGHARDLGKAVGVLAEMQSAPHAKSRRDTT